MNQQPPTSPPPSGPPQPQGSGLGSAARTAGTVLGVIFIVLLKAFLIMSVLGALGVALLFGLIISVCGK